MVEQILLAYVFTENIVAAWRK